MEIVGLLASIAFVVALAALSQVTALKKKFLPLWRVKDMWKNTIIKMAVLTLLAVAMVFNLLAMNTARAETLEIIDEDITKAAGDLEIPAGTAINGNVTLNLGELSVYGTLNGNVDNNMGAVNIFGDVNGNVEANLGQVVVDGYVSGDVKTRMGEVRINGSVGGNVDAGLGATRVDGSVGKNVESGFGDLTINGNIGGNVHSKGGNIFIGGTVNGNVHLEKGIVELGPGATVVGSVKVEKGLVNKDDTATAGSIEIGEEVTASELRDNAGEDGYYFRGVDRNLGERIAERVISTINNILGRFGIFIPGLASRPEVSVSPFMAIYGNIARGILNMLILFALAALTYTLFPKQVKATGDAVSEKTGPVLGWGILATLLAVPLMILLAITIIGIPLILVEIIVLAAAALLGYAGIADLVGRRIVKTASSSTSGSIGTIALGALIIGLIAMIPILGSIASLAVFIIALGAALATRFGTIQNSGSVYLTTETRD